MTHHLSDLPRFIGVTPAGIDLDEYINRVYSYLDRLPVGSVVTVSKVSTEQTRALFVECVKLFIEESNQNISFKDNTFTQFIKYETIK